MKLLPVYLNCVLKSDVLQPGAEVTTDDRAYVRQLVSSMDVAETNVFFYPRLLPLVRWRTGVPDTVLRTGPLRRRGWEYFIADRKEFIFMYVHFASLSRDLTF